ncbi:MAG: LPS assembly lipoprotein LptE [Acidobacteriota bacterium]|nr:LPS assembly lipoprotein LptE [Acidobacteriota bacterium]
MTKHAALGLLGLGTLFAGSCGYHVGGTADLMPKNIRTIAIPAFAAFTARYALVDELPQQIAREFSTRTRFVIVNNPAEADAVLNGTVNSALAFPTIFDPASGKATSVQLVVNVSVRLLEQKTGKVLYAHPNWGIREDYELAVDPHQFFDESGPAQDRLCRDVARDLVSAVVENF